MTTGRINQVAFLDFPRGRPKSPKRPGRPRRSSEATERPTDAMGAGHIAARRPLPPLRPHVVRHFFEHPSRRRPTSRAPRTFRIQNPEPSPRAPFPYAPSSRGPLDGPRDELSGPPRAAEAARPRIASSVANPFRLVRYATQQTQAHEPKAENGA